MCFMLNSVSVITNLKIKTFLLEINSICNIFHVVQLICSLYYLFCNVKLNYKNLHR